MSLGEVATGMVVVGVGVLLRRLFVGPQIGQPFLQRDRIVNVVLLFDFNGVVHESCVSSPIDRPCQFKSSQGRRFTFAGDPDLVFAVDSDSFDLSPMGQGV